MSGNSLVQAFWKKGCIVDLDCSYFSGLVRLEPQDVGLDDAPKGYHLGRKEIIPKTAIAPFIQATAAGRKAIYALSISFLGKHRYMPLTRIGELREKITALQARWEGLVAEFCRHYETHLRTGMVNLRHALEEVARHRTGLDLDAELKRILAGVPTKEDITDYFSFRLDIFQMTDVIHGDPNRDIDELNRRTQAEIRRVVQGVTGQIAGELTSLIDRLKNAKRLTDPMRASAREILTRIEHLNILDDQSIKRAITDMRSNIDVAIAPDETFRGKVEAISHSIEALVDRRRRVVAGRVESSS